MPPMARLLLQRFWIKQKGAGALLRSWASSNKIEMGRDTNVLYISAGGDMNINIAASQPRWATDVFILVSKPGFSFHLISKTGFKYV